MATDRSLAYTITVNDNGTATIKSFSGQVIKGGVAIDNLDKELIQLNNTLGASNDKFKDQKKALIDAQNAAVIGSKKYKQLGRSIEALKSNQDRLIGSSGGAGGKGGSGLKGVSAASGSADASLLEVGRTISDSNYGIRGMANNLSQLASNLIYTTKKAGGLAGGLKALWGSLAGPLGLIIVFQSAIALLEKHSIESQGAATSTSGFKDSLKELNTVLNDLYLTQSDVNKKIEEYTNLIILKNKIDKEQKENAEELAVITEKITENEANGNKIKKQRLELEKRGITEGKLYNSYLKSEKFYEDLTNKSKQERNVIIKKSIASLEELRKKEEEYKAAKEGTLKALEDEKSKILKEQKVLSDTSDKYKEYAKQIKAVQKAIDAITGGKDKSRKPSKSTYKEQILDLEKFILAQQKKEAEYEERHEFNKLLIKQDYAKKDLKLQHDTWVDKEKLRLKNFMLSNASPKAKAKAEKISNAAVEKARKEHNKALTQLNSTQAAETLRFKEKQTDKEIQAEFQLGKKKIANQIAIYDEQKIARDAEAIRLEEERIAKAELDAERFDIGSTPRLLAEIKISEMRMALQTQELDHEIMIINAKKNAQMEYVGYMSQIGGILSSIAGENKALAIASLLVTKGAAVAQVVIASNASIASQTAATSAAIAQEAVNAAVMGPYLGSVYLGAKTGILEAQLATGVARTKIASTISIASILASSISSFGSVGGGGSKGGGAGAGGGRTFDFNLAGSTGQNQLAQTIGGQVQQPIKAYVVSSEITNQQQFDNQIQGEVTIG